MQQQGDAAGAAAELAEAQRLNQKKADAQAGAFALSAGLAKLKRNDLAGAIASFRDAVRLSPEDPQAHYHGP